MDNRHQKWPFFTDRLAHHRFPLIDSIKARRISCDRISPTKIVAKLRTIVAVDRRWSSSMWIVRYLWKKRNHVEAVLLDGLGNPREGRSFVCRSWTVPRVEDRSLWRSITRVSSYGGLDDRCERSIGRNADTWTVSRQCACDSGASARRNARIATRNPPSCTYTASLLERNRIDILVTMIYLTLKKFLHCSNCYRLYKSI